MYYNLWLSMYKIYLVLLLFSINLFSQMLSMEDRYKQVYKNIEKKEYQEQLVDLIAIAFQNKNIIQESNKILTNAYENKILKEKLIILFVNTIYDNENSIKIKKALKELLKDEEFKTSIIKIIKSEKNTKKIFNLLKQYFIKKLDKRFNKIFKTYLIDKFLCQTNINTLFKVISKKILEEHISKVIFDYYEKNKIASKYSDKFKQKLVSLPYDYSVDAWFEKSFKNNYSKIRKLVTNSKNFNLFINKNLETLTLDIIYSTINSELFLKSYKKDFYNEFIKDSFMLNKILKSLIIDTSDELFDKIKEKRFNCFHLDEKLFKLDEGILIFYLKEILSKKELEDKVLPILYESLK